MVPGQVQTWHGGGRDSSQPCAPHGRPPPNPFTKQEPQGRKGGEAGGGEDGGRKGGGVTGEGMQDPPPGSLEMPQPSARLPALYAAPTRPGEPVGVRGAPTEPRVPASSAQPPRGPPLQSGRPVGPWPTVPPVARARVLSRPAAVSMPLLPLLTAAAVPRSRVHRHRRTLLLTSAGPAEPPLSTGRVLAEKNALLRPTGRAESWDEWEVSPEGREGAPPSRLGRRELHAAGVRQDAGFRVDAAPPVRRDSVSAHSETE